MPRITPEARASSLFLTGSNPPRPPRDLPKPAADHWRQITEGKSPDFFDGAAQTVLKIYVLALAEIDRVVAALAAEPVGTPRSTALTRDFSVLSGFALSTARQLRLTKTSQDRRSGHHDERSAPPDALLGGAIPFRK